MRRMRDGGGRAGILAWRDDAHLYGVIYFEPADARNQFVGSLVFGGGSFFLPSSSRRFLALADQFYSAKFSDRIRVTRT